MDGFTKSDAENSHRIAFQINSFVDKLKLFTIKIEFTFQMFDLKRKMKRN